MHTGSTSVLEFAPRTKSGAFAALVRVGLAVAIAGAPVTAALAQGTPAPNSQQRQTDGLRQPTPGRLIIPVTGTLGAVATPTVPTATSPEVEVAASPAVTGSFSIQRFARTTENTVAAVGTVTVSVTDPASKTTRTIISQIAMPLAKSGDSTAPGNSASPSLAAKPQTAPAANSEACEAVSLVLGSIDLNLLGLTIQLNHVSVDFAVAARASGRMGTLLCEVTGLIDGAARPADIVKTLNTLLDTIG